MWEATEEVLSQKVKICILSPHLKLYTLPERGNLVCDEACAEYAALTYQTIGHYHLDPLFIERCGHVIDALSFDILLF
jgi:hypothetical protein